MLNIIIFSLDLGLLISRFSPEINYPEPTRISGRATYAYRFYIELSAV